jgi:acetyl-CoA carboxylase biotin carboxyl carrier protein
MKDNDLVEIEIKHDDDKILLKRAQAGQVLGAAALPVQPLVHAGGETAGSEKAEEADELIDIVSPMVGTFYATPSPDSDSFVELGSIVSPSTVVCIIEAMKVMNEIKAEVSGKIEQILVESGQAVEFGQVLFKVKP